MMPGWLSAAMWAGLIALDFTGCGPWMISQPVVCGPLFGWMMGNIAVGLIIGGIVQLIWMDVTPVGVGIPYDATAATLLAVYWGTLAKYTALSQIIIALLMAIPCGYLFRWMDQFARRLNTRFMRRIDRVSDERLPRALWAGISVGLLWSWFRYAVTYAVLLWAGEQLWHYIGYVPKLTWVDRGLTMASILLPVAGMGVAMELFLSEQPEGRWASLRGFRGSKGKEDAG